MTASDGLRNAALRLVLAQEAYRNAVNGEGHPGQPHDRSIHFDPCTGALDVHVYSPSTDCAACGGAEYGTEDTLNAADAQLRVALGLPLRPWEAHHRIAAEPVR